MCEHIQLDKLNWHRAKLPIHLWNVNLKCIPVMHSLNAVHRMMWKVQGFNGFPKLYAIHQIESEQNFAKMNFQFTWKEVHHNSYCDCQQFYAMTFISYIKHYKFMSHVNVHISAKTGPIWVTFEFSSNTIRDPIRNRSHKLEMELDDFPTNHFRSGSCALWKYSNKSIAKWDM